MNVLEYSWNTLTGITGADYETVRLILDSSLDRPMMGVEKQGFLIRLPVPRAEKKGIYLLHGLYADTEENDWSVLWRLFRASLFHCAFHVLFPPGRTYSQWARDKDEYPAIFTISLLEDFRTTWAARAKWGALLRDVAFANYVGASRIENPERISNDSLRFACKLLLSLWGLGMRGSTAEKEDSHALEVAERVRGILESEGVGEDQRRNLLRAADLVYGEVRRLGRLTQIPSFPHTEAHSPDTIFADSLVGGEDIAGQVRAYEALGVPVDDPSNRSDKAESLDALQGLEDAAAGLSRVRERYERIVATTRLRGFELPVGDFASFQRARAQLAGPIRNITNQLRQVRNVVDEEQGKQSGQVDIQMAMQVVASGQQRTDVFVRDEPLLKDEAWVILLDASRSLRSASFEVRGMATCLAEVAKDLMRDRSKWALLAFNDKLQFLKDFEEPYSMEHKARIGGLKQEGPTYLPDALEVAAKSLAMRPTEEKYLVVVSDCLPTGYEGIEGELARVTSSLSKKGVMMIGLGVQSSAVKRYFRASSVLTTHHELMKTFVKAYLEISSVA